MQIDDGGRGRFAGQQNRHDRGRMAGLVEVLQVERIVPDLFVRGAMEGRFADLEFDRKHYRPSDQHGVDAPPHSRNAELE